MEQQHQVKCHKHIGNSIILICLTCQQHLLCQQCIKVDHKLHMIIKLTDFQKKIPEFSSSLKLNKNIEMMLKQINRIKQTLLLSISQLEHIVSQTQFKQLVFIGKQQQQINGEIQLFLKKNYIFKEFLIGKINQNQAKNQIQINLMQNLNCLRSIESKIGETITLAKKSFIQLKKKMFQFSIFFKHVNLKNINELTICKSDRISDGKQSTILGHSHLALLNESFNPMKNKVTFKIKRISQWGGLSIGVCNLDKVKANNYFKCWKMGCGTYGIYINEYKQLKTNHNSLKQYSNTLIKFNSQKLQLWKKEGMGELSFIQGDVITLVVDYFDEKIKFIRNWKQKAVIQIPIDLLEGPFYGFVGLSWAGDCIEII